MQQKAKDIIQGASNSLCYCPANNASFIFCLFSDEHVWTLSLLFFRSNNSWPKIQKTVQMAQELVRMMMMVLTKTRLTTCQQRTWPLVGPPKRMKEKSLKARRNVDGQGKMEKIPRQVPLNRLPQKVWKLLLVFAIEASTSWGLTSSNKFTCAKAWWDSAISTTMVIVNIGIKSLKLLSELTYEHITFFLCYFTVLPYLRLTIWTGLPLYSSTYVWRYGEVCTWDFYFPEKPHVCFCFSL